VYIGTNVPVAVGLRMLPETFGPLYTPPEGVPVNSIAAPKRQAVLLEALSDTVGLAFTVIVTVFVAVQLFRFAPVTIYVVVTVGLTITTGVTALVLHV
jgi:hypothetical protein